MKRILLGIIFILASGIEVAAQRVTNVERLNQTFDDGQSIDPVGGGVFRGNLRIWRSVYFDTDVAVDQGVNNPGGSFFKGRYDSNVAGGTLVQADWILGFTALRTAQAGENRLHIGSTGPTSHGEFYTLTAGTALFHAPPTGTAPRLSGTNEGGFRYDRTANRWQVSENGGAWTTLLKEGAGVVTSVGLSAPAQFVVTGSPVTSSGTLALAWNTQTANTVMAGPASGGAAVPTFRALVTADYGTGTVTSASIANGTILFADLNQNSCGTGAVIEWGGSAWICGTDDTSPGGNAWLTGGNTIAAAAEFGSNDAFDVIFETGGTERGRLLSGDGFRHSYQSTWVPLANAVATSGTTTLDSVAARFVSRYWSGTASTDQTWSIYSDQAAAGALSTYLNFDFGASTAARIDDDGSFQLLMTGSYYTGTGTGDLYRVPNTDMGANLGYLELQERATAPTGAATQGTLYFDSDDDRAYIDEGNNGFVRLQPRPTWESWTAREGVPPDSGFATQDVRNAHTTVVFSDGATETIFFEGVMPESYDGTSLDVQIAWTGVPTTGAVRWGAAFEDIDAATDIDVDSFEPNQLATSTTAATSGIRTLTTITFTSGQADGPVAGQPFRLRIQRIGADAADTMAGDAELLTVQVRRNRS